MRERVMVVARASHSNRTKEKKFWGVCLDCGEESCVVTI